MQGKPSRRTWHYPRCAGEAIAAYMALSKEGGGEERGGRKEEGAGGRREEDEEEEEGGGGCENNARSIPRSEVEGALAR